MSEVPTGVGGRWASAVREPRDPPCPGRCQPGGGESSIRGPGPLHGCTATAVGPRVSRHLTFTYGQGKPHPAPSLCFHPCPTAWSALCLCVTLFHGLEKGVSVDTPSAVLSRVSGVVAADGCPGRRTPWPTAEVAELGWCPQTRTAACTEHGSSALCRGHVSTY